MRLLALVVLLIGGGACNLQTIGPNGLEVRSRTAGASDAGEDARDVGGDAVLASIAGGAYQSSANFDHATRAPYPSTAAVGKTVDEWVSAAAWTQYAQIAPETTGSGAKLPAGTTIVRAVLGADGAVTKLTLMAKGPAGFNPDLGDWWFGETDPSGAPLKDDAGVLTGRLTECYSCHLARSDDDFLFGVPAADRLPPR